MRAVSAHHVDPGPVVNAQTSRVGEIAKDLQIRLRGAGDDRLPGGGVRFDELGKLVEHADLPISQPTGPGRLTVVQEYIPESVP